MHRDPGSNSKHHHQQDPNQPAREEKHESDQRHERQGWVRKYLDLADQAFRDDNGNDPTPNPA
jgi:hypothetical protein